MDILQLRYQIEIMLTIGFAILVFVVLSLCGIRLYLDIRKESKLMHETASLQCSQCHTSFQVPISYFIQHPFLLKKEQRIQTGGYKRLASRQYHLRCPACQQKTWCTYNFHSSPSVLSLLPEGMLKKHIFRFILLEGALFLFYIILLQLLPILLI